VDQHGYDPITLRDKPISMTAQTRQSTPKNFRWNFAVNAMDLSFYMLAMNIASSSTVIPLLVTHLTPSKVAVGAISAIFSVGWLLPQLFTAGYAEGLRRKKPFIMWVSSFGERLPWLIAGLAIGAFASSSPKLALVSLFICLGVASASAGVTTPAWYDMIAKVIPINYRGLWAGVSFGLGAFMGLAGSAVAGTILDTWPYPQSYMMLFILAFAAMVLSFVGLSLNREPDSEVIKQHPSLLSYLRLLPEVMRRDRNYRIFLVGRSVAYLSMMAGGFYIVYGAEKFAISGGQVGAFNAMLVGSQTVMNLLWGMLGDRKGHKIVLAGSVLAMALAAIAALAVPDRWVLWLVFFLQGAAFAGENVSGLNIILEFCAPEDRPTYIGLTNTLLAPSRALAPLVGGWLAAVWGYSPLFLATALVSLLGAGLLALWVKEPRLAIEKQDDSIL
jgi:MFS family permease